MGKGCQTTIEHPLSELVLNMNSTHFADTDLYKPEQKDEFQPYAVYNLSTKQERTDSYARDENITKH